MRLWKTRHKRTLLNHSKYLTVEEHTVELPDGQTIADWPWIITPDFVNVLAVTALGEFLLFRQTKYGIDGLTLAPVGGYIEPGEDPLAAAQRELMEETGFQAKEWVSLGDFIGCPNRGFARGYLYLALDARQVASPSADDLEEQEVLLLSRDQVEEALFAGEIKAMMWAANVALALQYLDHRAGTPA